jgi:hypothetical protein
MKYRLSLIFHSGFTRELVKLKGFTFYFVVVFVVVVVNIDVSLS